MGMLNHFVSSCKSKNPLSQNYILKVFLHWKSGLLREQSSHLASERLFVSSDSQAEAIDIVCDNCTLIN